MSYVGCLVSLDCGHSLGTYQGQVKLIDNATQLLTISQAFRNGIKCEVPEITISASDIKDLKILKTAEEAVVALPKQATPSKLSRETEQELDQTASPGRVREVQSNNTTESNGHFDHYLQNGSRHLNTPTKDKQENGGGNAGFNQRRTPTRDRHDDNVFLQRKTPTGNRYDDGMGNGYSRNSSTAARHTPTKDDQLRVRRNSASENKVPYKSSAPRKIEFRKKSVNRQDCFSAPVDTLLDDFDFEKNLALFDKKAVFEEIESSRPVVVKAVEKKPVKYRCDENVLQGGPVVLQQIRVPVTTGSKYVTDSGLVVPCIDCDLRNHLFSLAEGIGFSVERQLEMIGRSSSEMVLQLIGGSNRLNPQNGHQLPTVVVLCGPHIQGAQGLNCARHLVNHGVKTIVFLPNFVRMVQSVEQELKLYEKCGGKRYSNAQEAPMCAVDMIINCMDSHENSFLKEQDWYQAHARWVEQNRAPVFTIDPPAEGTTIHGKWSICPVLPLPLTDNSSQLYLCDLGLPNKVFKEAGISYKSPFGHKFIIPIHPQP